MSEEWKEYAVFLRPADGKGGAYVYTQLAQDPKTAWIQARLRHAGMGLPPVKPAFSFDDVKVI